VPTSRLTRITAVALATAAVGAPAASARPASEPGGNQPGPVTQPIVREFDQGFDTGSAALGAGGGAAVVLLALGGAAAITRHRHRVPLAH
jgi:hypothetical protein